ncbi:MULTISPECIES: nuclease-related domain-containing DEAD/DEAH box helicase [Methanocalculus]|uniref:nuclease-related domain-containing DEAD/DEAH box helicase n=1 Tax=Methanocalculus TaxID=71151 RepID=UPI00209F45BE|nr:NERD domain-containing protein [Methanocalculus sp. AMF5]MCP1662139.1 hypothetical protein [Methanocalculus sp. AMF5]
MAVLWPRHLTPDILADPGRRAEQKVYNKLKAVLEDPFTVFYSRPWLGTGKSGEPIDGECDFVVAHPDYGFLTIEVKGGGIAYDPAADAWTSTDRHGNTWPIKNPARQAVESKHQILKKCQAHPKWGYRRIGISHGVILPDIPEIKSDLGADMPRNILCCMDEFESDLRFWILDLLEGEMASDYRAKPLGEEGMAILEDILAHPFQLNVPLHRVMADDEAHIQTLTPLQYQILAGFASTRRVAISGSAGTGKTILAMEEAVRCIHAGERVLLTCYNRPLSEYMKKTIGDRDLLMIGNYHKVCDDLFSEACIDVDRSTVDSRLFLEKYPTHLLEALSTLPERRFDTLIIDEGQDFPPRLLQSLESALDPDGKQKIRLFYDNNQDVYQNEGRYLEQLYEIPFTLSLNLRNTQRIHEVARLFYKGQETKAIGPDGLEVEWIEAETPAIARTRLEEYIYTLVEREEIPPSDIAVLISTRDDRDKYCTGREIGGQRYQFCNELFQNDTTDAIIVDSVKRFKGLESPVTIVVLDDRLINSDEMLYVAFSRARLLLAIVGSREMMGAIRGKMGESGRE